MDTISSRKATKTRKTSETDITITLDINGTGVSKINTKNAFLNHLIASFSKHSLIDITIIATSLDDIAHHLTEDVAITLGQTINEALGNRNNITRFANTSVPMDESLASTSLDLVKRQYSAITLGITGDMVEGVPSEDLDHFFSSLVNAINCCVHITVASGKNDHHKVESAIKSLALAFRIASEPDSRRMGPPSSKGMM